MPIYAYRCGACGFEKDVLQKMSAAPLTECPSCKSDQFAKRVTAAGFQLKGSGWYVTDFRNGGSSGASKAGGKSDSLSSASQSAGGESGSSGTAASSSGGSSAGNSSSGGSSSGAASAGSKAE